MAITDISVTDIAAFADGHAPPDRVLPQHH